MKLIFLGPPGSGKGTISSLFLEKLIIPSLSTGGIFREEIKNETALGKAIKTIVSSGALVPDDITIKLVEHNLKKDIYAEGFILDGFPRTITQAEKLKNIIEVDKVIYLNIKDDAVIKRLSSRRTCKDCNELYNLQTKKPNIAGFCDKCGGSLFQRDDDKVDSIKKRLETFHSQTKPLVEFYQKENKLVKINADQEIRDVFASIYHIINN